MLSTLLSVFANVFSVIGGQVPERSFVAVKPDGVQRALCGQILKRFEKKGFKLVACKLIYPTTELLEAHYAEHKGKSFFDKLVTYMSSGPVFAMVLEGEGVVQMCRQMIGATKPQESMLSTIRGDYAIEMGRNIVHGSDSLTSANYEIGLWFSSSELISWESATEHLRYE